MKGELGGFVAIGHWFIDLKIPTCMQNRTLQIER